MRPSPSQTPTSTITATLFPDLGAKAYRCGARCSDIAVLTAALTAQALVSDATALGPSAPTAERLAAIRAAAAEAQEDRFFKKDEPFSNTHVDTLKDVVV